jgi:long-chain fatty acid transport protein
MAWVHQPKNSRWTYGLGLFGIAGFRSNYPSSLSNPVLLPQSIGGLGRIYTEGEFLQLAPTVAYALSDRLSVGIAPTVTLARVAIDPLVFASPVAGEGYTSGRGTRYHWGGGAQAGIYYIHDRHVHLGFSIKSPQWFEPFRFYTEDVLGAPRVVELDIDYPMILSLGTAYTGFEDWVFAADFRYFDYKNTDGFGNQAGFDGDSAVTGLGWSNVFSVTTGVQHRLTDRLYWRMGYTYQQNPIHSADVFFNVGSPLIIQHVLGVGASYFVTHNIAFTAAYIHGFKNRSSGPINTPDTGPIEDSLVASEVAADAVTCGITVRY